MRIWSEYLSVRPALFVARRLPFREIFRQIIAIDRESEWRLEREEGAEGADKQLEEEEEEEQPIAEEFGVLFFSPLLFPQRPN